jgi:hypothetical protein
MIMCNQIKKLLFSKLGRVEETPNIGRMKNNDIRNIIKKSGQVHAELNAFISDFPAGDARYVSLGQNCSSAWYLKEVGLKNASYPFDWIFSSSEIVLDCIDNDFSKYLDKSMIVPINNGQSAGHTYYHSNMFHHRNPLKSEEDYNYYGRCCDRFRKIIKSEDHIVYLLTLINESQKRVSWSEGFNRNFKLPFDQNYRTVADLISRLKMENRNSQFVIVDHYTEVERRISYKKESNYLFTIEFCAGGESTGVHYTDSLDDFCYKYLISGLIE